MLALLSADLAEHLRHPTIIGVTETEGSAQMAKAYSEEIVYTDTEDGLVLEGVVIRPTTAAPGRSRSSGSTA